jgi:hypothetical protein
VWFRERASGLYRLGAHHGGYAVFLTGDFGPRVIVKSCIVYILDYCLPLRCMAQRVFSAYPESPLNCVQYICKENIPQLHTRGCFPEGPCQIKPRMQYIHVHGARQKTNKGYNLLEDRLSKLDGKQ